MNFLYEIRDGSFDFFGREGGGGGIRRFQKIIFCAAFSLEKNVQGLANEKIMHTVWVLLFRLVSTDSISSTAQVTHITFLITLIAFELFSIIHECSNRYEELDTWTNTSTHWIKERYKRHIENYKHKMAFTFPCFRNTIDLETKFSWSFFPVLSFTLCRYSWMWWKISLLAHSHIHWKTIMKTKYVYVN